MAGDTEITERSLGWRILAHSCDQTILDGIRAAIPASCEAVLAVSPGATFEELRARHFDLFITDEPALLFVVYDRFPSPQSRSAIARWLFKTEYAYEEFLREYHERFHELSPLQVEAIPTILVDRYTDPARLQLRPGATELATYTVTGGRPAASEAIRTIVEKLLRS